MSSIQVEQVKRITNILEAVHRCESVNSNERCTLHAAQRARGDHHGYTDLTWQLGRKP